MGFFKRKKEVVEETPNNELSVTFRKLSVKLPYSNVEGFFIYGDTIYYKPKKGAGRDIVYNELFIDDVKKKFPEFDGRSMKEISSIKVEPLAVV